MEVAIFNERFLFRFGLDRTLLLIAAGLREQGHNVTLVAHRMDASVVQKFSDRVIRVPVESRSYEDLDEATAAWLDDDWHSLFESSEPDLCLMGGWPFFGSIPVLRALGLPVVFLDCGAVPFDGLSGDALEIQRKLRTLRKAYLPRVSASIAISQFIAATQTRVDVGGSAPVRTILLGADHLDSTMWEVSNVEMARGPEDPVVLTTAIVASRRKLVLNLGRWEPGCYKRSEAVFDVARQARSAGASNFALAILEKPGEVEVPPDLSEVVVPVGHPDDRELVSLMKLADAAVSVSEWEGFNLPVAEFQWLGKPALTLDVGAHREVVCHPWNLAQDISDMAGKLTTLLEKGHPDASGFESSLDRFRANFSWRDVQRRYVSALQSVVESPQILVDTSNSCSDPANSGVIRVTRRLCRTLQQLAEPTFTVWDHGVRDYVLPSDAQYGLLSLNNGPDCHGLPRSHCSEPLGLSISLAEDGRQPDWLLLTELVREPHGRDLRRFARSRDIRVAAIYYDAIPILHPELVPDTAVRQNHAEYMTGLAACDLVLPISDFSRKCLERFWIERNIRPTALQTIPLPDDFCDSERPEHPKSADAHSPFEILCVSTLEPRKNHLGLIDAVHRLDHLHPGLDWSLTLVGNRYEGAGTISLAVEAAACADPRIRWLGVVDDDTLHELYRRSKLTVYPSLIEGFGLPIVESLWHGTPVLCHDEGVMIEHASKGGCLTANLLCKEAFSRSLARVIFDHDLYADLAHQALRRPCRSWTDYAGDVIDALMSSLEPCGPRSR